jgi:phage shock protein A
MSKIDEAKGPSLAKEAPPRKRGAEERISFLEQTVGKLWDEVYALQSEIWKLQTPITPSLKTRIVFMNDTKNPIKIRQHVASCLPSVKTIEPQKLAAFFMRSDELFLKVWNDGTILIKDGIFGEGLKDKVK